MSLRSIAGLIILLVQLCGCAQTVGKPSDASVNDMERRHDEMMQRMGGGGGGGGSM
jgi:hypothetical protein